MHTRPTSRFYPPLVGATVLLLWIGNAAAETLRVGPVPRAVVEARLGQYQGTNIERGVTLKRLFVEAGCGEHLSEQPVSGAKAPNVICVHPGTSDKVIIVGAHFDRVSAGDGVVDNWSGASLLPSLYQAVGIEPRQHTYIFIGFTDEERGLVGSRFYVRQMTPGQVAATEAMVNMDTLGLASTKVWVNGSDERLTLALSYVARVLDAPVAGVNVERVGSTDSASFAGRKIPGITVHSLTVKTWNAGIIHSRKDKLSAMQLDDYYGTYNLLATYLVFLDKYFDEKGAPGEANR